jgi:hypothetical protein
LHIEEIGDLKYFEGDKVKDDWMGWACGGEERCLHGVVEEPEGKVAIGRPGCR